MAGKVPLTFKIYKGNQLVGEQTLTQDVIKVGKLSSAHLRIDDDSVSRMHAYIQVSGPGEIYISDLGSAKGTIVNGQRVNKAKLKSGDEIKLGNTRVVISIGQPAVAAAPKPAAAAASPAAILGGAAAAPVPGVAPGVPGLATGAARAGRFRRTTSYVHRELSADDVAQVEMQDGSKSIEVVAMFNNVPQMVRHYPNPKAGSVGMVSLLAVVLGLGVAIGGAAAFGGQIWSVKRQEKHQEKVKAFIKERGLNEKFVPKVGSNTTIEILGGLGFICGTYLFLWGAFRVRDERQKPIFTIGEHPDNTFNTPMAAIPPTASQFPILRSDGQSFVMSFTPKMEGFIAGGGQEQKTLEDAAKGGLAKASGAIDGAYDFTLPDATDVDCRLNFGDNQFLVRSVRTGRPLAAATIGQTASAVFSSPLFMTTSGAAAVVILFMGLGMCGPKDSDSLEVDSMKGKSRIAKIVKDDVKQKKKEEKKKEEKKEEKKTKPDPKIKTKGPVTPRDERTKTNTAGPPNPNSSNKPSAGKGQGLLGVLQQNTGMMGGLFSRDAAVTETEDTLAALQGITHGDAGGLAGLGAGGRGGAGGGAGGVGFGGWGGGKGGGGGGGGGVGLGGRGGIGTAGRSAGKPRVFLSRGSVRGGLDASTIRRIIRRHLASIQYCYTSKGLLTNPNLQGMVKISFTIGQTGRVTGAAVASSTLGHGGTERCVANAIRRIKFPKPNGPNPFVTYPFRFKPKGR